MNPFPYSLDNKRYHTWDYHLKNKFGQKVFKVPLSLATTCPNRDGSKGYGGCSFCSSHGGGGVTQKSSAMEEEYFLNRSALEKKWPNALCLPYFQSYTNTYLPLEELKSGVEKALSLSNTVGICIATRPDCLPDKTVSYLEELSKQTYLVVELGLQTIHEKTAQRLNRCHTTAEFYQGYEKLASRQIPVCVHIINGLPDQTPDDMMQTALAVSQLQPHSIKIHMLHLLKQTRLAKEYQTAPFELLTREEYVDIVCRQLELFDPAVVVQRVTGDPPKEELIAPEWTKDKSWVRNSIDKWFATHNSYQGMRKS